MGCALTTAVPRDLERDVDLSVKEKIVSSWNIKRLPKAQRREVPDNTCLQPDRDSHTFYCGELGSFLKTISEKPERLTETVRRKRSETEAKAEADGKDQPTISEKDGEVLVKL
mmetsp:Transcript_125198/g.297091  ORF Transcript_125198/g.297091 Transcript_125198/m.297091 type:complete len:113 (-) Transcript_125198:95-433(-)